MSHMPVNHHLRPLFRSLAALVGLYVLAFGIVGLTRTRGEDTFARTDVLALGLRTNPAFAYLSIVVGAVILVSALVGRNIDQVVFYAGSAVFAVVGTAMLGLMQTDANVLNFSVTTVIVSYLIAFVLAVAGLYGRVSSRSS